MAAVAIFVYLQLLDFLTTMVGFKVGASEASPFIAKLIHASSPVMGVAASKVVALALGAFCLVSQRARLVVWINYWYAGLIIWNMVIILMAAAKVQIPR